MEIGVRLKELRKFLSMTQQELADRLGLKQNTIATYETGRLTLSDRTISDICREFGVSERWLRDGVKPMFITRSGDEEITAYLSSLLNDADTDLQRKIILLMSKLPPETWSIIAQKAREVALEFPKDEKKE